MDLGVHATWIYKDPKFFVIDRDGLRITLQDGASGLHARVGLIQTHRGHIHIPIPAPS